MTKYITTTAIRFEGVIYPVCDSINNSIIKERLISILRNNNDPVDLEFGFTDTKGEFYSGSKAMELVRDTGQIPYSELVDESYLTARMLIDSRYKTGNAYNTKVIISAATKLDDLIILSPHHHDETFYNQLTGLLYVRTVKEIKRGVDGFVDQHGTFYDRSQALELFIKNKQKANTPLSEEGLYSENLYPH